MISMNVAINFEFTENIFLFADLNEMKCDRLTD